MKPSKACIDLVKKFEGIRLNAYLCPAGVPTIGYGTIHYPDGKPVKMGHVVTMQRAEDLLKWEVEKKAMAIVPLVQNNEGKVFVNQSQFDALVSFAYNLGYGALKGSTLLKKVRNNPSDETIRAEFMKWTKAKVKGVLTELPGLVRRRDAEADLYFTKTI